jgi:hypothetical protein
MRKKTCPRLHLERESILHLETPALQGAAAGNLHTLQPICPTRHITCITCFGTCTC